MNILLCGDNKKIDYNISQYFEERNYHVYNIGNDYNNIEDMDLFNYDVFIFDECTCNNNSFQILKYVKKKSIEIPIIILSHNHNIDHIKQAFDMGCHDYIKKPFEIKELELRIMNLSKLFKLENKHFFTKELYYDLDSRSVIKNKKVVNLSKKQLDILHILIKNRGQVVSIETLIDNLYYTTIINHQTITSHIRDIHKKIGTKIIENFRGLGYKIKTQS